MTYRCDQDIFEKTIFCLRDICEPTGNESRVHAYVFDCIKDSSAYRHIFNQSMYVRNPNQLPPVVVGNDEGETAFAWHLEPGRKVSASRRIGGSRHEYHSPTFKARMSCQLQIQYSANKVCLANQGFRPVGIYKDCSKSVPKTICICTLILHTTMLVARDGED